MLQFLAHNKDAFSAIESMFKVAALLFAGFWSYRIFIRKREKFPRAKLIHVTAFWDISEKERILRVTLSVENHSDVLLQIYVGKTWIQAMKPWPEEVIKAFKEEQETETRACETKEGPTREMLDKGTEIGFPVIAERHFRGEREVEPKESDDLVMDFVIDKSQEPWIRLSNSRQSQSRFSQVFKGSPTAPHTPAIGTKAAQGNTVTTTECRSHIRHW